MKPLALLAPIVLAGCPRPPPPPGADEPPRLPAVESCATEVELGATPLPVPVRPPRDPYALDVAAAMSIRDGASTRPVTMICDLPDRILGVAAEQGVAGGKRRVGGSVYSIPRLATAPALPPIAILASSPGCREGAPTCTWDLASPALVSIDTIPRQRVSTSGWVKGPGDLCRALPDDTIATCSTATRLAYVELGCQAAAAPPVALQLGLHDASLERRYDLDVEVPVARLYGAAEPASDTRLVFRFTGPGDAAGRAKAATLVFDLAANEASLELDGAREPCLAFGITRQ